MAGLDSDVKLLLHCNGADASTDFPDASDSNHTVTAGGNAQVDTAQKEFGTASALFDATRDYLTVPASSDFNVGSGNFTVDFWYRPNAAGINKRNWFFASGTTDWKGVGLDFNYTAGGRTGKAVGFYVSSNGSSWDLANADSSAGGGSGKIVLAENTWHHIALVRNGNNWMTFINGVKDIDITVAEQFIMFQVKFLKLEYMVQVLLRISEDI